MGYHEDCKDYNSDFDSDFNTSHSDSNLDRKFDIAIYGDGFDFDTTMYEEPYGLTLMPCPDPDTCPCCGRRARHWDCIVIAIDGACRGNGMAMTEGAIGIYFADESKHNISQTVVDIESTSQKNELRACLRALRSAMRFKLDGVEGLNDLTQVLIKADSRVCCQGHDGVGLQVAGEWIPSGQGTAGNEHGVIQGN